MKHYYTATRVTKIKRLIMLCVDKGVKTLKPLYVRMLGM